MSWSTSELRVRLAPLNRFKPSSNIFYWPFQGGTSFVDLLCFCSVLCLLCLYARLFICALWSPAGKGLTSWLSFVVSNCEFVTFPLVSWAQVWSLIVSIPDLCTFTYFLKHFSRREKEMTFVVIGALINFRYWYSKRECLRKQHLNIKGPYTLNTKTTYQTMAPQGRNRYNHVKKRTQSQLSVSFSLSLSLRKMINKTR